MIITIKILFWEKQKTTTGDTQIDIGQGQNSIGSEYGILP